ncbi:MAG: glycerol-3-phosphate dehydrogenase/oxidase [Chloroflexota bacterium]|nr:glycerol-3-phosphate dehydrogenase/oxidase [Chloroflexota bacterium]
MGSPQTLGTRAHALHQLSSDPLDLLVVGGGIMGAGVLLEASLRGLSGALVEQSDFAGGASSRSTKLVHGGLRYLMQGRLDFVRESLEERAFLLANAPGLVAPLSYVAPLRAVLEPASMVGQLLSAYDDLSPDPPGLPHHRRLTEEEVLALLPFMRDAPGGGFEYHEGVTDDARLTIAVLKAAVAAGATPVNHVKLVGLRSSEGSVDVEVRDTIGGEIISLSPRAVVLAAGAWLGQLGGSGVPEAPIRPSKGTHVVLAQTSPPIRPAIVLSHPADARPLSVVPWKRHLLLGSTDTECQDADLGCPQPTGEEVTYLLDALRHALPEIQPEVTAAWAGVRPLVEEEGAATAGVSREHRLVPVAPHVVAILGGKLTTFRRVAEDAVDDAFGRHTRRHPYPVLTDDLHASELPEQGEPLFPSLPYTRDHLRLVAETEMVASLDDALTQRLGISLVRPDEAGLRAEECAETVGDVLGWSSEERARQVAQFRAGLGRFRCP